MKPFNSSKTNRNYLAFTLGLAIVAIGLCLAAVPATAHEYFLHFFPITFAGAGLTQPQGLNNAGVVVGTYGSNALGFLWKDGVFTDFTGPDGNGANPSAINSLGQIVGNDSTGGFLDSDGTFTTIAVPGARATGPNSINDSGTIVGQYLSESNNMLYGFIYNNGTYTSLAFPQATSTGARGVNNSGEIVGFYTDSSGLFRSFTYSAGVYKTLVVPGCQNSAAFGINNNGDIVGWCDALGFLFSNQKVVFFNYPAAARSVGFGINDGGRIVGQYYPQNGIEGFLAAPIL
jgi:uncharacterized membrane protein